MSATHTPGPWRWEINQATKEVNLVGGVPRFDLTVMDFARWGMGGAAPRFRDTSLDGMNLMDRVCDKPEWLQDFPGRSHHARWCRAVIHPDAVLMAAAPDLLELHKKHMELMMEIAQELKRPRLPLGQTVEASVRMLALAAKEALDAIEKTTGVNP